MSHSEPEHNRPPEGTEPDEPFPMIGDQQEAYHQDGVIKHGPTVGDVKREIAELMAVKHHPSCRTSDLNLVWHCSQCGLNESAADIEEKLNEHIKAANEVTDENITLEEQLAAEREKVKELEREVVECNSYVAQAQVKVSDMQKQLASEREIKQSLYGMIDKAHEQLAEEREKVTELHKILGQKRELIKEARAQRDCLVRECERISVGVFVECGKPVTEAYHLEPPPIHTKD